MRAPLRDSRAQPEPARPVPAKRASQSQKPAQIAGTLSPPSDLCKTLFILSLSKDLGRGAKSGVWLRSKAKTGPSLLAVWIAACAAKAGLLQRSPLWDKDLGEGRSMHPTPN